MSHKDNEEMLVGWNVGGTTCSAVIGTSAGKILRKCSWPSRADRGPEAMISEFKEHCNKLLEGSPHPNALGVSIGGPLDPQTGVIYSAPHLPGWKQVPLRDLLTSAFQVPVRVEHDAVACLMAEWLWGAPNRQLTHVVYLTAGTGFGAGIMINGRIVRGPGGQTTEIGHVRLAEEGPRLYGKEGCVESFCSGTGISLLAQRMFPSEFSVPTGTRELCQLCAEGSDSAREVLMTAAKWTGRVCALLVDLFSPQMIIAGSMARYLPAWWLEEVRDELRREALPRHSSDTQVVAPLLGDDLQDLSSIVPCLFGYGDPLVETAPMEHRSAVSSNGVADKDRVCRRSNEMERAP
jgi:glucokinase